MIFIIRGLSLYGRQNRILREGKFFEGTLTDLVELGFFSFVHVYEERHYENN